MKKYLYCLLPFMVILSLVSACKDNAENILSEGRVTYLMRLDASIAGFHGQDTRSSSYTFADKDKLYILFHQDNADITGTAVFDMATNLWKITPSKALSETENGRCQLAFFLAEGEISNMEIALTQQTRIYTDVVATYQMYDDMLTVQAQFSPALGRIRFKGQEGQTCTVTGLAFASFFDLKTHKFGLTPNKLTATCAADGYTPYYYGAFADEQKRQLIFDLTAGSGLGRTFGEGVMQAGTSGYVTIPTVESHDGWTLVNNLGEQITFATISKPVASDIRGARATLTATITSTGGGHLSDTGFVIATHETPTVTDRKVECGTQTSLSSQIAGLTPETTYFARAYAVNEIGISYSEEISFTTVYEEVTSIEHDEWNSEENWNDAPNTQVDVDRVTYPEDENWN